MNKNPTTKKKLREFGFLIGIIFPILVGWFIPSFGGHSFRTWTLWIGLPSLIAGIFQPNLLFYPYKFWMEIGKLLGWINSRLLLGLVFFLILQPISIIMKLTGYDPLRQKRKNQNSYREKKTNQKLDLTRIF